VSPLLGLAGIMGSLYFVFTYEGGGFTGYFDLPSAVLLGIAPPSIMLLSHSVSDFITGINLLIGALFINLRKQQIEVITTLTNASKAVRSDGLGALINYQKQAKSDLLKDGLSLIVNDFKPEEIRHNLTARINTKQSQMALSANLFENMSKVCPGVGMIGTLLGLITMLSNMKDPSTIGAGMALAMITTLYGIALGTILYAPISEKIQLQAERVLEIDLLVLEGVMNIKGKKSSVHLKDILKTYGKSGKKAT